MSARFWLGKISKFQEKPYNFQHILGAWKLKSISVFSNGYEIPYDFQQKSMTENRLWQIDEQADQSFLTVDGQTAKKNSMHQLLMIMIQMKGGGGFEKTQSIFSKEHLIPWKRYDFSAKSALFPKRSINQQNQQNQQISAL